MTHGGGAVIADPLGRVNRDRPLSIRRLVAAVVGLAIFAAACSSSGDESANDGESPVDEAADVMLGSVESTYTTTVLVREDGDRVTLAPNEVADLRVGDVITPIDDGITEIRHADGSRTIAGDDETVVRIPDGATPGAPKVTIEQGTVVHERADSAEGEPVEFSLPGFAAQTEQGAFVVECDDDAICFLVVLGGAATVTTSDAQVIELDPSDAIEISADGEIRQQTTVLLSQLAGSDRLRLIARLYDIEALDFGDGEDAEDPFPVTYSGEQTILFVENVTDEDGGELFQVGDVREFNLVIDNRCSTVLRCELIAAGEPVGIGGEIAFEFESTVESTEEGGSDTNWFLAIQATVTERGPDGLPYALVGTMDGEADRGGNVGVYGAEFHVERSEE